MGTSGILLQETKNAFKIITKDNKLKSKYRRELCRDVFDSTLLKVSSRNLKCVGLIGSPGSTPLCKPYWYVLPQRVGFGGLFGLKTGIEPISVWHRVWFSRELLECMNVLMNKNEIEICDFEMHLILKKSCALI